VIAGGSEGLGQAFARQLAGQGFGLVLIGRKLSELDATAAVVAEAGAEVRTLPMDLTDPGSGQRIGEATAGLDVGLLIANAGANSYGSRFLDGDLDKFATVVDVNITSRIQLVHHFGNRFKSRGRGAILLVGSMAGYRGTPNTVLYNASKAFDRVFAEGLWAELGRHGIDVVEFVVGAMRTPAMARRGMTFGPGVADPEAVAAEGLAHIGDGPVWNSQLAGGDATAAHLSRFPRESVITEATEMLRSSGLYPDI
jgi:short-subunit dehydrogenase